MQARDLAATEEWIAREGTVIEKLGRIASSAAERPTAAMPRHTQTAVRTVPNPLAMICSFLSHLGLVGQVGRVGRVGPDSSYKSDWSDLSDSSGSSDCSSTNLQF